MITSGAPSLSDAQGSIARLQEEVFDRAAAEGAQLRIIEALLFAAGEPLDEPFLAARLPAGANLPHLLQRLAAAYAVRGVNLVRVAGRWTFRTAPDLKHLLSDERAEPRRLSRAAMETLASWPITSP